MRRGRFWVRAGLAGAIMALATACAAPPPLRPTPDRFAAGLAGFYSNALQWAEMTDSFRATAGLTPADVRFVRVTAPQVGETLVYEEWRAADASKAMLRQRLWLIRPDGEGMRVERFALQDAPRFAGAGADAFITLSPADLKPLGAACALKVRFSDSLSWDGRTQTGACRGEDGEPVNSRITKSSVGLLYSETRGAADPATVTTPFDLRRR